MDRRLGAVRRGNGRPATTETVAPWPELRRSLRSRARVVYCSSRGERGGLGDAHHGVARVQETPEAAHDEKVEATVFGGVVAVLRAAALRQVSPMRCHASLRSSSSTCGVEKTGGGGSSSSLAGCAGSAVILGRFVWLLRVGSHAAGAASCRGARRGVEGLHGGFLARGVELGRVGVNGGGCGDAWQCWGTGGGRG